jgi:hypothetical protein
LHVKFFKKGIHYLDSPLPLLVHPASEVTIMSESLHEFLNMIHAMGPTKLEQHFVESENLMKPPSNILNYSCNLFEFLTPMWVDNACFAFGPFDQGSVSRFPVSCIESDKSVFHGLIKSGETEFLMKVCAEGRAVQALRKKSNERFIFLPIDTTWLPLSFAFNLINCPLAMEPQFVCRIGSGRPAWGVFSMSLVMTVWTKGDAILNIIVSRNNVVYLDTV